MPAVLLDKPLTAYQEEIKRRFYCRDVIPKAVVDLAANETERFAELLEDEKKRHAWMALEWHECSRPGTEGWMRYLNSYLTHQPVAGGGRQPLTPREWQLEVAPRLTEADQLIAAKTRRAGFTIITAGLVGWFGGIAEDGIGSVTNYVSKKQDPDTKRLIKYTREHLLYLPEYMEVQWGTDSQDRKGRKGADTAFGFVFASRGAEVWAHTANNRVRGDASTLLILDEYAHYEHPEAEWEGAKLSAAGGGRVIVFSSPNGQYTRKGAHFYHLYQLGKSGETRAEAVFIPCSVIPNWETERMELAAELGWSVACQELPLTEEEGFAGDQEGAAYRASGIGAVVEAGKKVAELRVTGELPDPKDGEVTQGIDWGDNSADTTIYALPRMELYVCENFQSTGQSAQAFSRESIARGMEWGNVAAVYYDAAGKQQMKDYIDVRNAMGLRIPTKAVPFGDHKKELVNFLRILLERTEAGEEWWTLAIDPSCKWLIEQLPRMKQREDGTIDKESGDDDHSHDAFLASLFPYMQMYRRYMQRLRGKRSR